MRTRLVLALLCLIALLAELTLDSSTAFVREKPSASVGRLVVAKKSAPGLPDSGAPRSSDDGGSDLLKFASASSHAGQVATQVTLQVAPPVARHDFERVSFYVDPRPSDPQRPPSA